MSAALMLKLFAAAVGLCIVLYPQVPIGKVTARTPRTGEVFTIQRSHTSERPFVLSWALEGYRRTTTPLRGLFLVVLALFLAVPPRLAMSLGDAGPQPIDLRPQKLPLVVLVLAGVVGALLCRALAVNYPLNQTFGDGPALPVEVARGDVFAAEPAAMQLYQVAKWALGKYWHDASGLRAIRTVDYLSGGVFFAALASLAFAVGRTAADRITLFLGCSLAGYCGMFFGYVETTQVATAAIAVYFAAAAAALEAPAGSVAARVLAFGALGLAGMAHGAGILLWPSALFLFGNVFAFRRGHVLGTVRRLVAADNVALVFVCVVLPYVLVVLAPFYLRDNLGNVSGGGDRIMFVPRAIDYAHRVSRWVYYSRFSAWHLADIANAVWASALLAPILIVTSTVLRIAHRLRLDDHEARLLGVLGTAALGAMIIPVFWNHDFGMWGDWNLSATFLLPANVLAWVAFVTLTRRYERTTGFYAGVVAPLLLVQVAAWFGLLGQLYA